MLSDKTNSLPSRFQYVVVLSTLDVLSDRWYDFVNDNRERRSPIYSGRALRLLALTSCNKKTMVVVLSTLDVLSDNSNPDLPQRKRVVVLSTLDVLSDFILSKSRRHENVVVLSTLDVLSDKGQKKRENQNSKS